MFVVNILVQVITMEDAASKIIVLPFVYSHLNGLIYDWSGKGKEGCDKGDWFFVICCSLLL